MKYKLQPGDMINRTGSPAVGVLVKKVVAPNGHVSWEYVLRSPNLKSWQTQIGRFTIDEEAIYRGADEGKVEIHCGNLKNRKIR